VYDSHSEPADPPQGLWAEYADAEDFNRQFQGYKADLLARLIVSETRAMAPKPDPGRLLVQAQFRDVPEQPADRPRLRTLGTRQFDEDFAARLCLMTRQSDAACEFLVRDVCVLMDRLPLTWTAVTVGIATLAQGRKAADAVWLAELDEDEARYVDERIAVCAGRVTGARFQRALRAAVMKANPALFRKNAAKVAKERFVRRWDTDDARSAFVKALVDKPAAIYFDATVQLIADRLRSDGGDGTNDELRAQAFALMANPAAAVQYIGVPTTWSMPDPPTSQAEVDRVVAQAAALAPAIRPPTVQFENGKLIWPHRGSVFWPHPVGQG
jgi:hypothetical protein